MELLHLENSLSAFFFATTAIVFPNLPLLKAFVINLIIYSSTFFILLDLTDLRHGTLEFTSLTFLRHGTLEFTSLTF